MANCEIKCKCGEVALSLSGGFKADISGSYSALDVDCIACSATVIHYEAGLRIIDAGIDRAAAKLFEQPAGYIGTGQYTTMQCSCGNVVGKKSAGYRFSYVSHESDSECQVSCCAAGCADPIIVVPAGYQLIVCNNSSTPVLSTKWPSR